ncbi:MAG: hypothetical protein R3281_16750 [Balneolaceae bacterium]|nr:hypothetical protein [Balneolaceae bacterium]
MSNTIASILNGTTSSDDLLGELLRMGAQRILQEAAEAEMDEFLGRGWCQRNSEAEHRGYRNGYTPVTLKTTQGPLRIDRPPGPPDY